jgi:hypothetical protein
MALSGDGVGARRRNKAACRQCCARAPLIEVWCGWASPGAAPGPSRHAGRRQRPSRRSSCWHTPLYTLPRRAYNEALLLRGGPSPRINCGLGDVDLAAGPPLYTGPSLIKPATKEKLVACIAKVGGRNGGPC